MVLQTLSNQHQRTRNGKFTDFSENNPSFENQPNLSFPGVSSIGKINSDYERGTSKGTDKSLEDTIQFDLESIAYLLNLKKYLPRRHTHGETSTSNEFDTLTKIAVLHEHQRRINKKLVDEEVQKSVNPYRAFGTSTTFACSSDSFEDFFAMKTRSSISLCGTSVKLVEACSSIEAFVMEQCISGVDEHTHDLHPSDYNAFFLPSEGEDLTAISKCVSTSRTRKHKIPIEEIKSQGLKARKPQRSCDQKKERNTLTKETQIRVENMLRELAYSELIQFYMVDLPYQRRGRTRTKILQVQSSRKRYTKHISVLESIAE